MSASTTKIITMLNVSLACLSIILYVKHVIIEDSALAQKAGDGRYF